MLCMFTIFGNCSIILSYLGMSGAFTPFYMVEGIQFIINSTTVSDRYWYWISVDTLSPGIGIGIGSEKTGSVHL